MTDVYHKAVLFFLQFKVKEHLDAGAPACPTLLMVDLNTVVRHAGDSRKRRGNCKKQKAATRPFFVISRAAFGLLQALEALPQRGKRLRVKIGRPASAIQRGSVKFLWCARVGGCVL
ncbi:hypothetical protein [Sphaerisporangium dianthi]|uniref:Uncharacterized protein n=1 Tax=Sphaerisporangium dianthi TaxID=1436120 RepID=A0ABV9CRY5_9ACTN